MMLDMNDPYYTSIDDNCDRISIWTLILAIFYESEITVNIVREELYVNYFRDESK